MADVDKKHMNLMELFLTTNLKSKKHQNYFQVYEILLARFVKTKVKFLEIGVLDGGSLSMWRKYFGPEALIVGLDVNPRAKELQSKEFDIYIGNQSHEEVWKDLYSKYGQFDVILDDGGHTNRQQIMSVVYGIDLIRDEGMLIVEDTHCSYLKEFGNPSKQSFINFANHVIDKINTRFFKPPSGALEKSIYSVQHFESISVFHVNRNFCVQNIEVTNIESASQRGDHRFAESEIHRFIDRDLPAKFWFLKKSTVALPALRLIKRGILRIYLLSRLRNENRKLRRFF